jgi:hypothetical protein
MLELVEELDATYTNASRSTAGGPRPRAGAWAVVRGELSGGRGGFARARQLRLNGFRVLTISRETGISPRTLSRHLRRHGTPFSGRGRPPLDHPTQSTAAE